MANYRKRSLALTSAAALVVALAACGGSSDSDDTPTGDGGTSSGEAVKGGTLSYLQHYPYESTDPQRIYYGEELAAFRRLVYRSLVAFPYNEDPEVANTPVPDLATDTGTPNEDNTEWSFTLKDGIKWEDGSDITCEDFQYGASRAWADDVLTGGAGFYFKGYLDLKGDYNGPYKGEGQEFFDEAVSCDGNTITYKFNKPWPDFPLSVASLTATDPYKESFDDGPQSQWKILSNGPYKVEGNKWDKNTGATFVRNDQYDPATDSQELRQANPDEINYELLTAIEPVIDRIMADAGPDAAAVTGGSIPPAYYAQMTNYEDRTVKVDSPYVRYLIFNNEQITDPNIRKAIAVATNVNGVITASGGENAGVPADSIVNSNVGGYTPNPAYADRNLDGDPEAAAALLEEAGVETPFPITYTYSQTETADKVASVLKEGWDAAGFETTLDPLGDTFYDVIGKKEKASSVMFAGWGADWPSPMTVSVPLFTSNPEDTETASTNYGFYSNAEVDDLFEQAASAPDIATQNDLLAQADAILGEDAAYVPIYTNLFYMIHGSKVGGYMPNAASSSYPDLGPIYVMP